MTTGEAEAKVLTIEELYGQLKNVLKEIPGGDADVLAVLEKELLHPSVNEKINTAKALTQLTDLAASRARTNKEEADANPSKN